MSYLQEAGGMYVPRGRIYIFSRRMLFLDGNEVIFGDGQRGWIFLTGKLSGRQLQIPVNELVSKLNRIWQMKNLLCPL